MTIYHQVLNQLEELHLLQFRNLLPDYLEEHTDISLLEGLHDLLHQELSGREQERLKKRLKKAHLPYNKRLMDFDFLFQPKLNKAEIVDLHTLRFLDNKDNILFIGNSGVGKTHLAISLALEALDKGFSSYFILSNDLVNKLLKAQEMERFYCFNLSMHVMRRNQHLLPLIFHCLSGQISCKTRNSLMPLSIA